MQWPVPRRLCVAEFLESAAPLAACGAHSGDANRISQNGNRRTMTTVDIHRHASHKPLHDGDMESVLWGIEKGPLLRQTMTAVLILDRPPDRETLLDRLERASRTLPRHGTGWWKCPFACRRHAGSSTRISICRTTSAGLLRLATGLSTACSNSRASRRCRVSTRLARCGSSPLSRASADAAAVPDLEMLAGASRPI